MSEGDTEGAPEGLSECSLWIEFHVELTDRDDGFPLDDVDLPARVVRQHVEADRCLVHVATGDESGSADVAQMAVECDRKCVCHVMADCGCVPHLEEYRRDGIRIGTHLSDRADLDRLVEGLRAISDNVSLRRLSTRTPDGTAEPITVDLSSLTEKQREAAILAVSKGYYRTPRQTSAGQLAEALSITKSALSQRLSAVESKLATAVFDDRAES
ncbi:MAG: helix-turn-helix domain-containing protein [Halanaeroarchaeum sp.]